MVNTLILVKATPFTDLLYPQDKVLSPPPLNKILVDEQQIQLLLVKVHFFMSFLENYPRSQRNKEIERVERRIADAAHAAEDIIESNVVDQIHAAKDIIFDSIVVDQIHVTDGERFSTLLCQGIQTVLEKFISIEKELPMMMVTQGVESLQLKTITASSRLLLGSKKITMVGFDQHLEKIMSELASDEPSRRVIPIVGMGGIGKTTLATVLYKHPYIVEYFDARAWVTVSQEYTVEELLNEINKAVPDEQGSSGNDLRLQLHKKLFGRRYLIVMDDVWDVEALEDLKRFLPPNENGSRVMVTSRLSYLTDDLGSIYKMDFLNEGHSRDLLRKTIFGEEDCPVELEEIGKEIAQGCNGLPLAFVLIGGLLAQSERIREHWEYFFERDMTSALNSGNDEQVLKILYLSYTHLPVNLKPCFLYLALFPEDFEIRVSMLVRLWVAEGLIKPTQDKCLEEVAHEYVEDLISRNVMLVDRRGSRGKVKYCKLHDRVRDLCITEAEKQEFVYISKLDNPFPQKGKRKRKRDNPIISPYIEIARRLSIYTTGEPLETTIEALRSATLNRLWLSPNEFLLTGYWDHGQKANQVTKIINGFRLLKVMHVIEDELCIDFLNLCNLRYVFARTISSFLPMTLCWNLQIIIFCGEEEHDLPVEIWQMPQLRHLRSWRATLPDPPDDDQNAVVLENLHTLADVYEFKCSEQVIKRIPNLKKLHIKFSRGYSNEEVGNLCLQNLACFKKLEVLRISGDKEFLTSIIFPVSLKKLQLVKFCIPWEYLSIVVGSLPNLEALKLFKTPTEGGEEWNPIEGKFRRLKFLMISASQLRIWGAEKEHFPCLD